MKAKINSVNHQAITNDNNAKKTTTAQVYLNPLISASLIVNDSFKESNPGISDLFQELMVQVKLIKEGKTQCVEDMLYANAQALQSIFINATLQMNNATHLTAVQVWGNIALKAQNQSRQTLASLMDIKNPKKVEFIKLQNNAINQQINTSELSANPQNSENLTNELLKEPTHATLDCRRTAEAIPVNQTMATMERVKRCEDSSR